MLGELLVMAALSRAADSPGEAVDEVRAPTVTLLVVREEPDAGSAVLGRLARGEPVRFVGTAVGPGCERWGLVEPRGYACLDQTVPFESPPADLPRLVAYDPPRPEEEAEYARTGTRPRVGGEEIALLPHVYARRDKADGGWLYADSGAFERQERPVAQLALGRRTQFVGVQTTTRGLVLVRPDGRVVPESDVFVYPVSRFSGRDLLADPPPPGGQPAWTVEDWPLYEAPPHASEGPPQGAPEQVLPARTPLWVEADPERGGWRVPSALGEGRDGWIAVGRGIRVWQPSERPPEVASDEVWVDVVLGQQILAVLKGEEPLYVTLVSTGAVGLTTPTGTFRITDKVAWADMSSLPGADSPYHVEAVPWTVHYAPRYALHGTYWHDRFGFVMSHGCVNLAPLDARVVFDLVAPALPTGWHSVVAAAEDPGSVVRVRW